MLRGFMALYDYQGPLAPGLNFVENSLTYFYSLLISSSALHLIAERLASVKVKVWDSGCKHTLFRPFSIVGPLQFSITND